MRGNLSGLFMFLEASGGGGMESSLVEARPRTVCAAVEILAINVGFVDMFEAARVSYRLRTSSSTNICDVGFRTSALSFKNDFKSC